MPGRSTALRLTVCCPHRRPRWVRTSRASSAPPERLPKKEYDAKSKAGLSCRGGSDRQLSAPSIRLRTGKWLHNLVSRASGERGNSRSETARSGPAGPVEKRTNRWGLQAIGIRQMTPQGNTIRREHAQLSSLTLRPSCRHRQVATSHL